MKILCLIIDSVPHEDWRQTYEVHRRIWNQCLDKTPQIDGRFLYADPKLGPEVLLQPRSFTVRCEERYDTIFYKTRRAIDVLLSNHTHVIRTNISSVWDFPLLLKQPLPKEGVYMGHEIPFDLSFVSGSGMILSHDVAKKLTRVSAAHLDPHDDVAIAQVLNQHGIRPQHRPMLFYDYTKGFDQITIGNYLVYRLRDMDDPKRVKERQVTEQVYRTIYG